jgi:uncharacterized protein (TIGR03086 family)
MTADLLDLYDRASAWAIDQVRAASDRLDASTSCDGWDVRTLMNHMLDTQGYFVASARGEPADPPAPDPPDVLADDPVTQFDERRTEMLAVFGDPEVRESARPALGIAFADQVLHGWDLACATGQDPTMPDGLAQAAFETIHGRFTDENRPGVFKPEIEVSDDASPQEKLLAYAGRKPT